MNAVAMIQPPVLGNATAEAALCGAMMMEGKVIDQIADVVAAEDFSDEFFGHLFSTIVREHSLGRTATPVTLRAYYKDEDWGVLANLTGGSPAGIIGAKDIARQIADLGKRRRLIESLTDTIASARQAATPVEDVIASVEVAVSVATRSSEGTHEPSASEAATEGLRSIESGDPGMMSGIEAIDTAIGAIRAKNLAILAGRPGMGKTAVALSYALGAARNGIGVLFVSLEMSAEELGQRLLSDMTYDDEHGVGVPYDAIVNGRIDRNQMRMLMGARDQLESLPFRIVDTGGLKMGRLSTIVRRWRRRFAAKGQTLGLVVVDYLQLLHTDQRTSGRYETITEISMGLKELAKVQQVGVLALAQLSRKVEERHDKRPMLSDLRDSGQIEQDADIILFLLREEYYLRKAEPHPHAPEYHDWSNSLAAVEGKIEFICAKRRKGAERTTTGRFYGAYQAVRG